MSNSDLETLVGHSAAVMAALGSGLLRALYDAPVSVETASTQLGLDHRAVARLLEVLESMGVAAREAGGFRMAPRHREVVPQIPASLEGMDRLWSQLPRYLVEGKALLVQPTAAKRGPVYSKVVDQLVKGFDKGDVPPDAFAEQQAAYVQEAHQAAETLVAEADRGLLGPLRSRLVRWLCRVGRELFAAREHPKFYWLRALGVARGVFVAEGRRLEAAGVLAAADDVWFLAIDELIALADGEHALAERVPERREAHRRYAALEPARVLTSMGEVVVARHQRDGAPAGALLGTSASAGVAEVRVRVIHDPASESLAPGEVLVAAYTDPGWTPLFPQAAALVMEVGGQMTHGSVVAREYGIPAVVCVPGATTKLRTGQRVRVDGDHGWVEVLSSEDDGASAASAAPGGDSASSMG